MPEAIDVQALKLDGIGPSLGGRINMLLGRHEIASMIGANLSNHKGTACSYPFAINFDRGGQRYPR